MAIAAVRAAAVSDVDEIVRLQATTWAAAYFALVPAAAIDQLRGPAARAAWTAAVASGAGHRVLVATEGEWTVGFCAVAVAAAPDGPATPAAVPEAADSEPTAPAPEAGGPGAWGEVGVLLVEPRWGRRGHGGRLLAAAADALRADGARYGLAWIPESDEASRRFYARAGWEPDGAVRGLDTGDGTLREIRLTGSLDLKVET